MATSALQIEAAIKAKLVAAGFAILPSPTGGPDMEKFIKALSEGIYENLVLLSDTQGSPPSPTHV